MNLTESFFTIIWIGITVLILSGSALNIFSIYRRMNAEKRLKEYLKNNQIKFELKNSYIEMRYVNDCFYCKERTNGKKEGRFFYVKGEQGHVMTAWGLINAAFKPHTKYSQIRRFYLSTSVERRMDINEFDFIEDYNSSLSGIERYSNNNLRYLRSTKRFFYEDNWTKQPDFIMNEAQNEYCRLTIKQADGKFYILCKEIWGNKYFYAETDYPEQIIREFKLHSNKMETYASVLRRFKYKLMLNVVTNESNTTEQTAKEEKEDDKQNHSDTEQEKPTNILRKNDERNVDL